MKFINASISKIEELNPTIKLIKLDLSEEISFEPGQFTSCIFEINNKKVSRSYSFASLESENTNEVEFCIRLNPNGELTPHVFSLKVGDNFKLILPMGKMVLPKNLNEYNEIVFLATGTGVAPFRSMIKKSLENKRNTTLFFGCSDESQIIFKDEWNELSKENKNFKVKLVLSDDNKSEKYLTGFVQDQISKDIKNKLYIICGNLFMTKATLEKLNKLGVKDNDIIHEIWIK